MAMFLMYWALAIPSILAISSSLISISAPATAPATAPTVDPTFPGFAFEARSFYYVAGPPNNPNTFSANLIANIANRTNSAPAIRVGGTSLQSGQYNASQTPGLIESANGSRNAIPRDVSFGPGYLKAFNNIPSATYRLDLPVNSISDTITFVEDAFKYITSSKIVSLELGNEPNLEGLTQSQYIQTFQQFQSAINTALGISPSSPRWQLGSLGSDAPSWNASYLLNALGSDTSSLGSFTSHYYQLNRAPLTDQVGPRLMNHGNIVSGNVNGLTFPGYAENLAYLQSLDPPIPYILSEVACGRESGNYWQYPEILQHSFGAALWQVDYTLYAMSLGFHRVNMQSGLYFEFGQFNPVVLPLGSSRHDPEYQAPAVWPNYYATVFAADFIGRCGTPQVEYIAPPASNAAELSAYALYINGNLARIALVNLNFWNGSDPDAGPRGSQPYAVRIPAGIKLTQVILSRLTSPLGAGGIDEADVTWAGENWTYENDGIAEQVGPASETVNVVNGVTSVVVNDSEAVIITIQNIKTTCASRSSNV